MLVGISRQQRHATGARILLHTRRRHEQACTDRPDRDLRCPHRRPLDRSRSGDHRLVEGSRRRDHAVLTVQAAYDTRNAYLRLQWKTKGAWPGVEYPYYRFDGKEWKAYGGPRLKQEVRDGKQPAIYEDRVSIMLDDGKVPLFAEQGCWLTCHDGERDTRGQASSEEAAANPLLAAIKKTDVRKYLPATRTDPLDWKTGKPLAEIERLKAAGGFVDLIQWRAHRSNPVGMADDGYVLEYRNFDAGKNPFAANLDKETRQPKFMFDAAKAGGKAVTAEQVFKKEHILVQGGNAVPFDAAAGWKEGDMLPQYVLSAAQASGSAADNKASGSWQDGVWTVVIIRPLGLANSDDKALAEGGVYNVGFAVHDDNVTSRAHYVSLPTTLGIGAKAKIEAVKLP
uniref:Cytochrome c-552/DMSO reductase-like haem-binding domain-containing protein n=1 Tax=Aromatoleum anaerobium TaxID=182180 RepID=A0ABX1PN28_9RHOO